MMSSRAATPEERGQPLHGNGRAPLARSSRNDSRPRMATEHDELPTSEARIPG
jgi:hypothetical protein